LGVLRQLKLKHEKTRSHDQPDIASQGKKGHFFAKRWEAADKLGGKSRISLEKEQWEVCTAPVHKGKECTLFRVKLYSARGKENSILPIDLGGKVDREGGKGVA